MILADGIISEGKARGYSPSQLAEALGNYRNDIESGITQEAPDERSRFQAVSRLDDDHNAAIDGLRTESMKEEMDVLFPNQAERLDYLTHVRDGKELPPQYVERAKAVNAVAASLPQAGRRFHGQLEFRANSLGRYVGRPTGDNQFEFLVQGAPPEPEARLRQDALGRPIPQPPPKEGKYFTRKVEADRGKIAKDLEAEIKTLTERLESGLPTTDFSGWGGSDLPDLSGMYASSMIEGLGDDIKNKQKELAYITNPKTTKGQVAAVQLMKALKDDEEFKDTIPNNWIEQFERGIMGAGLGFAKMGAAVTESLGSDLGKEIRTEGQNALDIQFPGALRNEFENKDGTSKVAMATQGIESLATLLAPGAALKVAGPALRAIGVGGELVAATEIGGRLPGFAGFGATAYGNSYAQRLTTADNEPDPEKANLIRAYAPFMAAVDALKEVGTEFAIPGNLESALSRGLRGSLPKRVIEAGVVVPMKEGGEEVVGVGLEHLYQGTPGTQKPQNVVEAFQGGAFGAAVSAPMVLASNGRQVPEVQSPAVDPVVDDNGGLAPGVVVTRRQEADPASFTPREAVFEKAPSTESRGGKQSTCPSLPASRSGRLTRRCLRRRGKPTTRRLPSVK